MATPEEVEIYFTLIHNPDFVHVTPDGHKLYLLGPEGALHMIESEESLSEKSADEINRFIQNYILDNQF